VHRPLPVLQGGQQGISASLGRILAVGALCLRDGAHAVLQADHLELRLPQTVCDRLSSLSCKASHCGSVAHSELGGRNLGEICSVAFLWAGVRQAQAAMVQCEGKLDRWWAVYVGLHHNGCFLTHYKALWRLPLWSYPGRRLSDGTRSRRPSAYHVGLLRPHGPHRSLLRLRYEPLNISYKYA
jgi:hypothetical protein